MHNALKSIVFISVALAPTLNNADQTSLPKINPATNGKTIVGGQATPGSAPITIYDLSYPARTALGSGKSMDNNGYFAVSVSPPLISGHQIVAEDAQGRISAPVVVADPPAGIAAPAP